MSKPLIALVTALRLCLAFEGLPPCSPDQPEDLQSFAAEVSRSIAQEAVTDADNVYLLQSHVQYVRVDGIPVAANHTQAFLDLVSPRHGVFTQRMSLPGFISRIWDFLFNFNASALGDIADEGLPDVFGFLNSSAKNTTKTTDDDDIPDLNDILNVRNFSSVLRITQNGEHDFVTFIGSVGLYGTLIVLTIVVLGLLIQWYPLVYKCNALPADARPEDMRNPQIPERMLGTGFFGWIYASWRLELDMDLADRIGLDMVMFLQFLRFSLRLLVYLGVPMIIVFCPLHAAFGVMPSNSDFLGRIGMTNLPTGSWVFWLHAAAVWCVVCLVDFTVQKEQSNFIEKRFMWLSQMQPPRSATILIQNIPEDYQNKLELERIMNDAGVAFALGPNVVKDVNFVKPVGKLQELLEAIKQAKSDLFETDEYRASLEKGLTKEAGSMKLEELDQSAHEKSAEIARLEDEITQERARVIKDETSPTAFVTFNHSKHADVFLNIRLSANELELIQSLPPDPVDIHWQHYDNLTKDPNALPPQVLGYLLVLALFLLFAPVVATISALTKSHAVAKIFPILKPIFKNSPWIVTAWNGLFGSIGLTIFMALLPWCLMLIFNMFFTAPAAAEAQLFVQKYYYGFQVVFVILITAVGSALVQTVAYLGQHPTEVFELLATTLPNSTHFYLNWYALQWFASALGLVRLFNLIKFLTIRAGVAVFFAEEQKDLTAKIWSEPESQANYGIGARSADSVLLLLISLIFCSLTPEICIVGAVTICINLIIYGYLIVVAETRKPDLGGLFWCEQLRQVQLTMFLYIFLMVGVLLNRAATMTPGIIAFACLPFHGYRYFVYLRSFRYDKLPALWAQTEGVVKHASSGLKKKALADAYVQPELRPDIDMRSRRHTEFS
jgi:hypothetical protein